MATLGERRGRSAGVDSLPRLQLTVNQSVKTARRMRLRTMPPRLPPPAVRIVGKGDQPVTVINLSIKHPKQSEPERAGDLRACAIADVTEIESNQALVFLFQMAELQD